MPLKTIKKSTQEALTLEWVLHVKNYKLNLDKNLCVGCQICALACPKEAIKLEKQPKTQGEKAKRAKVDIDLAKCNFCGICDILCPYGAVKVTLNGQHILSVIEKESFPQLIRDIQVDASKYPTESLKCEEACPLNLVKITWFTPDGKTVENVKKLTKKERKGLQVKIDVDKEHCPCCRICEFKCPEGVMRVKKFIHGKIAIHAEKCPEGCTDCLDVCPITGTLYYSDEDKKVHVDEMFCVYCGACKVVCPVEDALELKRTRIIHTLVRSGAWNKALERLASPIEVTKELKAKGSRKGMESVEKRLGWKGV
ncbi:MAG: 4Fe-4S dicluster domain-containing protein [Candidatus Bathyarchaeota archaeon]|jgi:4Fe-4S ferredoxin|nr:4Fe-4S dicluster domain-containing protein [Candidatus Bathyarchaeota archaeon A05DMB-5]MDH7558543.1 4Fe-4S dicluster domain-containing protein [Candidatus Bathyarchaeota archaeon]